MITIHTVASAEGSDCSILLTFSSGFNCNLMMTPTVLLQVSVLVMCHTRELAFQISKEYERFSKYMPTVKVRHRLLILSPPATPISAVSQRV